MLIEQSQVDNLLGVGVVIPATLSEVFYRFHKSYLSTTVEFSKDMLDRDGCLHVKP